MATDKSARDAVAMGAVVVAVIVVILANLLADRKFARIDLTSEGRFSISDSFMKIMGRLEDPAKITYYVLKQVPPSFESNKRDILDKLNEIKTASKGKIDLEVVDPTENKELRERLAKEGFEHDFREIKKDQISLSRIYTGLEITYQNKPKGKVPGIGDAEQLEYALGSVLTELTLPKKPIIAIQAPPSPQQPPMMGGQRPPGSGYEWLQSGQWEDAKKFEIKSVDLTEGNSIPTDAALFVLIRPKALSERQRYEVVKYLASGGRVLLLASPFKISRDFGWRAEKSPSGLEDYLKEAGITFGNDFVADNSNLEMQFLDIVNGRRTKLRLPYFVRIQAENIDQQSVLTRLMPGLVMPFPAEIKLDAETALKNGLNATVLAKTSKQSWTMPFSETFNPDQAAKYDEATQKYDGSKNVFVLLDGQFPFPYEGKPVPKWDAAPAAPTADAEKDKEKKDEKPAETASVAKKPGRLLLCSAPDAFSEQYLADQTVGQELQANIYLILNITTTSGLGDDLANLRVKRYEARSIQSLSGKDNDATRNWLKLGMIAGVPIFVVIAALVRTVLRKSAQTRYERKFAQTIGPSSFTP